MIKIRMAGLILGVAMLAACTPSAVNATKPTRPASLTTAVTGTVTYLVRRALPPTAAIEVVLQDASLVDASAKTISTQTLGANGKQVPFPYELKYNSAQIDPKHTYTVRATIDDGGKLLFTSTQRYPVITNGAPISDVEIVVEPVSSDRSTSQSAVAGPVIYWNRSALPPPSK